jgi:hypothetical protein
MKIQQKLINTFIGYSYRILWEQDLYICGKTH